MNEELSVRLADRIKNGRKIYNRNLTKIGNPCSMKEVRAFIECYNPSSIEAQDLLIWIQIPIGTENQLRYEGFECTFLYSEKGISILRKIMHLDEELAAIGLLYV